MPTIADLLAVGVEIGFEGKTYTLREPNLLEQGKFQRYLEQQAREAARRDDASQEEVDRQVRAVNQDAATGVYEFGGELAVNALTRVGPITQLLYIVLSKDYPEVTYETCRRMMDRNTREIVAGLAAKVVSDPKAVRATLVSLGLPEDYLDSLIPAPNAGVSSSTSETLHSDSPEMRSDNSPTPNSGESTPLTELKAESPNSTPAISEPSPSESPTPASGSSSSAN